MLNSGKVFCVGLNKTGTSSLERFFQHCINPVTRRPYNIPYQGIGEALFQSWVEKKYDNIIQYGVIGDVFQDLPMCLDGVAELMDKNYPHSKFILTIRDSAEIWYNSLINFHIRTFGKLLDTKSISYHPNPMYNNTFYVWDWNNHVFNLKDDPKKLYNKEIYINYYNKYNNNIIQYFENRKNNLLILNIDINSNEEKAKLIKDFLSIENNVNFPHINKT